MGSALAAVKSRDLKTRRVEELKRLFQDYRVVGVVDLYKSSADLIHVFRSKYRNVAVFKVSKKKFISRAAFEAGRGEIAEYVEGVKRPIGLVFTNLNPFSLMIEFDRGKVLVPPRPNETADIDIVVPPINTGLQPGPILSEFGRLRIPTRIEGGTIWIARETVVARKGEVVGAGLASLLSKLEIGAVYKSVKLHAVFDGHLLIPSHMLHVDIDGARSMVEEALSLAYALAAQVGYTTPETIRPILAKAQRVAAFLSTVSGYPTRETVSDILALAESQAVALMRAVESRTTS